MHPSVAGVLGAGLLPSLLCLLQVAAMACPAVKRLAFTYVASSICARLPVQRAMCAQLVM